MDDLLPTDSDTRLSDYFRPNPDGSDFASESVTAFRIDAQGALIDALRGLFHGPSGLVRLRLWVFMGLLGQSEASLSRDELNELFHAVRPEALETVFKRFRDTGLLLWDETQRRTSLTPLAQQLAGVLGVLNTAPPSDGDDGDLASLLGQVVGADQLGTLDAAQVQMLQAQLGRLHAEFEDAIASGSEFRLREARKRYDRAARLIDKASTAITAIIGHAHGHVVMERAARALGQAQSRLLAMASQFNRALQQVDRQRVTLGTTGITSTDVKRWLQTVTAPEHLLQDALSHPVGLVALAPHELLDVAEAEFERDRPTANLPDALPASQAAPLGELSAVALPQALADLSDLLAAWHSTEADAPTPRTAVDALLGDTPLDTAYAEVAYKAQLLPLLGDAQACLLPGATGDLARQPWRVEWSTQLLNLKHPTLAQVSAGQLLPVSTASTESTEPAEKNP